MLQPGERRPHAMNTNGAHEYELPRLPDPEASPPQADAAPGGAAGDEAVPQVTSPREPWSGAPEVRRIVLRVHGAEEIELGRTDGREHAVRLAREMIGAIEEAQAKGEWPLVEDRFIRPGAIVSIDVQRSA